MINRIVLIFIIALLSFGPSAQAIEDLEGCYETILIDGKTPDYSSDWERNFSRIEIGLSSTFLTLNRGPLTHFLLVLFTGAQGNWTNYHPFVAFTNLGSWQRDSAGLTYQNDHEILMWEWGLTERVDHQVEITLNTHENGMIEGEASFFSQSRGMSGRRSFLLKESFCP